MELALVWKEYLTHKSDLTFVSVRKRPAALAALEESRDLVTEAAELLTMGELLVFVCNLLEAKEQAVLNDARRNHDWRTTAKLLGCADGLAAARAQVAELQDVIS